MKYLLVKTYLHITQNKVQNNLSFVNFKIS